MPSCAIIILAGSTGYQGESPNATNTLNPCGETTRLEYWCSYLGNIVWDTRLVDQDSRAMGELSLNPLCTHSSGDVSGVLSTASCDKAS